MEQEVVAAIGWTKTDHIFIFRTNGVEVAVHPTDLSVRTTHPLSSQEIEHLKSMSPNSRWDNIISMIPDRKFVKCINKNERQVITIDDWYEVLDERDFSGLFMYRIKNDLNNKVWVPCHNFSNK